MSQKVHQNSAPKCAPMSEHKPQETPITGVSPDNPFPVPSEETGKPATPQKEPVTG